jgi:hypothetical protein
VRIIDLRIKHLAVSCERWAASNQQLDRALIWLLEVAQTAGNCGDWGAQAREFNNGTSALFQLPLTIYNATGPAKGNSH